MKEQMSELYDTSILSHILKPSVIPDTPPAWTQLSVPRGGFVSSKDPNSRRMSKVVGEGEQSCREGAQAESG